jgi:hypothetical protein
MKRMLKLSIVLIISLSLNGCSWFTKPLPPPEPVVKIVNVYHYTPCEKDEVPNYVELDPTKHLGSAENANILISNLEVERDYSKSLLTTIDCYEKQIEKSEKTDDKQN